MLEALLARFRQHDRLALSRLLTHLSRGEHVEEILAGSPATRRAHTIVLTGSAGVGKSTLVGRLIQEWRKENRSVAVLACDPQSPLTGGALLGDRFRMPSDPDDGVYIRSLATAGGQEAIARHLGPMVQLLGAFGFDLVVIETVGAGQGDTAARGLADVLALLIQSETGDDLQWEKAGVLEVADVIVVQKADLPGAQNVEKQVRAALEVAGGPMPPVLRVSAKTGDGVAELARTLLTAPQRSSELADERVTLLPEAQRYLSRWYARATLRREPGLRDLLSQWRSGALSDEEAGLGVLRTLVGGAEPRPSG